MKRYSGGGEFSREKPVRGFGIVGPGHLKVPNCFVDKVWMKLPITTCRVHLFLWRKIYGFRAVIRKKKLDPRLQDAISISQITRGARVGKRQAQDSLQILQDVGLIRTVGKTRQGVTSRIEIVIDFDEEDVLKRIDVLKKFSTHGSGEPS